MDFFFCFHGYWIFIIEMSMLYLCPRHSVYYVSFVGVVYVAHACIRAFLILIGFQDQRVSLALASRHDAWVWVKFLLPLPPYSRTDCVEIRERIFLAYHFQGWPNTLCGKWHREANFDQWYVLFLDKSFCKHVMCFYNFLVLPHLDVWFFVLFGFLDIYILVSWT